MPYIFGDYLIGASFENQYLIEDINIKGGFSVASNLEELDAIPLSRCKVGMLVRCLSENKIYELAEFTLGFNEDWEEIVEKIWIEFKVVPTIEYEETKPQPLSRWNLTLKSTVLQPGGNYKLKIPVSQMVAIGRLEVDSPCHVEMRETESELGVGDFSQFQQMLEFDFTEEEKVYYKPVYFPDGTFLRSRYVPMMLNKDPNIDKYIYYSVTNTTDTAKAITAKFIFVALQLN